MDIQGNISKAIKTYGFSVSIAKKAFDPVTQSFTTSTYSTNGVWGSKRERAIQQDAAYNVFKTPITGSENILYVLDIPSNLEVDDVVTIGTKTFKVVDVSEYQYKDQILAYKLLVN